jgi:hypothetical protein
MDSKIPVPLRETRGYGSPERMKELKGRRLAQPGPDNMKFMVALVTSLATDGKPELTVYTYPVNNCPGFEEATKHIVEQHNKANRPEAIAAMVLGQDKVVEYNQVELKLMTAVRITFKTV